MNKRIKKEAMFCVDDSNLVDGLQEIFAANYRIVEFNVD